MINNGKIETAGQASRAVDFRPVNTRGVVINNGEISTSGLSGTGIVASQFSNGLIENNGLISTTGNQARGITAGQAIDTNFINRGLIVTSGNQSTGISTSRTTSDSNILNLGIIETFGGQSDGISAAGSVDMLIFNGGKIIVSGGLSNGILAGTGSTGTRVENSGAIDIFSTSGAGIAASGQLIIVNSGRIFALDTLRSVLNLTSADDHLTLLPGTRLQGRMQMGDGEDTVVLDHRGRDIAWRWTFEDFQDSALDELTIVDAPYVIEQPGDSLGNGITVTVADITTELAASPFLSDITNAVHLAVENRLASTWALARAESDASSASQGESADQGPSIWFRSFGGSQSRPAGDTGADLSHIYGGGIVGLDLSSHSRLRAGAFAGGALSEQTIVFSSEAEKRITNGIGFVGLHGRLQSSRNLFLEGSAFAGYSAGDVDDRIRANNLVMGGIERIEGNDAKGAFGSARLSIGQEITMGGQGGVFVPKASLAYATQWREGYEENAVAGQEVSDYMVSILSARLELAYRKNGRFDSGVAWSAGARAGGHAEYQMSSDATMTLLNEDFAIDISSDDMETDLFLGGDFAMQLAEGLELSASATANWSLSGPEQIGAVANLGVALAF